jgi:hypothetical protein
MSSASDDLARFVKAYFSACIRRDFDAMLSTFYPGDVDKLKANLIWCSQAMARFGESTGFLAMFGPDTDLEDLRVLSPQAFLRKLFEGASRDIPPGECQDIALTFRVLNIHQPSDDYAEVEYSYEAPINGTSRVCEKEVCLSRFGGRWYVMLNPGLRSTLDSVRQQVESFNEREKRDRTEWVSDPAGEDLEPFALWGFRDGDDRVILEPRFGGAGKFSSGLAPVKFFKKWGYIAPTGAVVIPGRFDQATEFSEGLAAVAVRNDEFELLWGYIRTDGTMQIEPRFASAEPFVDGVAEVTLLNDEDEEPYLIDAHGQLVDEDDSADDEDE